jgi:UDP-N-acetylglucosamine 2-epimerase (non-hydrolysing)
MSASSPFPGPPPPVSTPAGSRLRVMVVYGTRPEAVKMAPLVRALRGLADIETSVLVTGQHRSMLDQVNEVFGIVPDVDLDIHQPGQTLSAVTIRSLRGAEKVLQESRPDMVAVQGDTTTTFAVALAAFYQGLPVAHLEAGLRTNDPASPFPEEINRRLTTQLSALHLAPTWTSRRNLIAENVDPRRVVVTGNTVIDALHLTVAARRPYGNEQLEAELTRHDGPVLLVTAHRRESWGTRMEGIGRAVQRIAARHPEYLIVVPAHRNPIVRDALLPHLHGLDNVRVVEPLPYGGFCQLMNRSSLILTDSGGVQEEGPSLGKPVLVMRDTTERPEAVEAGTVRLVGTDEGRIVTAVCELMENRVAYQGMARAVNPYGDGHAAARSVAAIRHFFGLGPQAIEFNLGARDGASVVDLTQAGAVPVQGAPAHPMHRHPAIQLPR